MKIKDIPCVILSGGKSSRMGEDKSLLPFGDYETLIQFQYEKLSKIFSKVYISSKEDKFDFEANLIIDTNTTFSPMVALQQILNQFDGDVFIITVDIPLVKTQTISLLTNLADGHEITVAQDEKKTHNLCGVFNSSLIPQIDDYIKDDTHRIETLLNSSQTQYIGFQDEQQFINLNTKEEYSQACKNHNNKL